MGVLFQIIPMVIFNIYMISGYLKTVGNLKQNEHHGYVLPCVLRYLPPSESGVDDVFELDGMEVVGLMFMRTRCHTSRLDLLAWVPQLNQLMQINVNSQGCRAFLKSRVCDLNAPIENLPAIMRFAYY